MSEAGPASESSSALPPMLADRGPCLHCGTDMQACWNPESPWVCCDKCEHGRAEL